MKPKRPSSPVKAGPRPLARVMERDFGPRCVHVGHIVMDGGIAGDRFIKGILELAEAMGEDGLINLECLAEMYWNLYKQSRAAWTHELDIRTHKENF